MILTLIYQLVPLMKSSLTCKSPENKEVDWYVIFLFPEKASADKKLHYGYIDNTQSSLKDYLYKENNFPPTIITKYVLNPQNTKYNYFFWNDDKRYKGDSSSEDPYQSLNAHAKGSLIYDQYKGSFLLHSLPRFPTRERTQNKILSELPGNAGKYAQHFLCISINKSNADKIVELLNLINAIINKSSDKDYVNNIPSKSVNSLIMNKYDNSKYILFFFNLILDYRNIRKLILKVLEVLILNFLVKILLLKLFLLIIKLEIFTKMIYM